MRSRVVAIMDNKKYPSEKKSLPTSSVRDKLDE
jgi:hypothetical protein